MNARDVRLGGRWTWLQRLKNDLLWALASAVLATVRPLPRSVLRRVGRALGLFAYAIAVGPRATALANVARVYPRKNTRDGKALVRRCFVTAGEALGETVASMQCGRSPPIPLSEEARGILDTALAEGRGVVFASAHLGPWERVAASLVVAGVPLVVLARESYDPRFSRLFERLRADNGVPSIWRARPGAAAGILRALRNGRVLGVPMDLRTRTASCAAPFLGHDAPTAVGPARIALRLGAPVVVGTAAPAGARSSLRGPAGPETPFVITATRIAAADLTCDDNGSRILTGRINDELSRRILAMPHAWVWMHERWNRQSGV